MEAIIKKGYARESALILVFLEWTSGARNMGITTLDQQASSVLWVLTWSYAAWSLFSEKSSFKISQNGGLKDAYLPSGDLCVHITLKGIYSRKVDGNLIDKYVPKQRKWMEQNVRSGKSRENSGQVQKQTRKRVNWDAFMVSVEFSFLYFILKILVNQQ